jgi:hypothetical protein
MIGPLLMDSIISAITATVCAFVVAVGVAYGFLTGLHRLARHRRHQARRHRHQARLLDLEAARAIRRRPVHRGGLGVIVYADPRDVEAAWSTTVVPRLRAHLTAIHASSERLLDAAEIAGYDPAFCEKLRRLHFHHAGLLEQMESERRNA